MSSIRGATKDLHIDKRFTALELIGGYDCYPDMPQRRPDLSVAGGFRVGKTACFEGDVTLFQGDTTVEGNLTVLQNSYLANVFAERFFIDNFVMENMDIYGNLVANNIIGNVATIANITTECLEATKVVGGVGSFGSLTIDGNIEIDSLTVAGDAYIAGKLTVDGLIDPTGLVLDGQLSSPAAAVPGKGVIWVDNTNTPAILVFEDDEGNVHPVMMTDVGQTTDLDMNAFSINNVNLVDGRDVQADGITTDSHVADTTIHFTEASISHGNISDLDSDDHTQYILSVGRSSGQIIVGGLSVDENLSLIPNSGDINTGNVIVAGTIDSLDSTSGSLKVAGGLGVAKNIIGGKAVAGGSGTLGGTDTGVTIPDNLHVFFLSIGIETGAFILTPPTQTITGQVVHVFNGSGQATTGIVTAVGAGATIVCDGLNWHQL